MQIKGKTALVTGGAKRVGRVIALELAKKGADILLHYNHSEKEAKETAAEIKSAGVRCFPLKADLSVPADIVKLAREAEKCTGRVDILVNSASLFFKTPVATASEADFDRLMDANLKGPFLLSVEIGRKMAKHGGKIVNIADWSGFRPYKDYSAYCASKAASSRSRKRWRATWRRGSASTRWRRGRCSCRRTCRRPRKKRSPS